VNQVMEGHPKKEETLSGLYETIVAKKPNKKKRKKKKKKMVRNKKKSLQENILIK